MQHRRFQHRAVIDFATSTSAMAHRLHALFAKAPSDRIAITGPVTITYREEPPWYFGVTYGAMQGLAILTHFASTRTTHRFAATATAAILDLCAIYCLVRLLFAIAWRLEVHAAEGRRLLLTDRVARRLLRVRALDVDDLGAALVVGAPGARRVVLTGVRNEERTIVWRERFLDPPVLATWMADLVATVASVAGHREREHFDLRCADPLQRR
jgi:hypothetical protein